MKVQRNMYKLSSETRGSTLARGERFGRDKLVYCQHFNSLKDLEEAEVPAVNREQFKSSVVERGDRSRTWLGMDGGFPKIQAMTKEGWKRGEKQMREMAEELMPTLNPKSAMAVRRRRKRTRGDFGTNLDMDQVYQGRMDIAWTKMKYTQKNTTSPRNVALFIDASVSGGVRADAAMWRGAVAFVLQDYLIRSGYSVKIVVGQTGMGTYTTEPHGKNEVFCASTLVKDYQTHVSPQHLAILVSVGFFRTYGFKQIFLEDRQTSWGLGRPINDNEVLPWDLKQDKDHGALVVRVGNDVMNRGEAVRLLNDVKAQLEKRNELSAAS